jgi:polyisoprenoid-binding protein YceI
MSTTVTLEQVVPTGTWNADPHHSQVDFSVTHMKIATIRGTFPDVTATLTGGEGPTLEGTVTIASVSTGDADRDGHLQSPDFFDAERYPQASFVATLVTPDRVVGEFTLKGVTKEIELAAAFSGPDTDPWGNERLGLELTGEINRHDYGVSWNTPLPGGGLLLEDTVRLSASFSFVKEA